MREVIWQDASGLEIVVSDTPGPRFVAHLASVPFGTTGSAFWRLNIDEQLQRFERPTFLSLRDEERVIGSYVLDEQRLMLADEPVTGIYRGLLTIDPERRHAGLGRELARQGLRWMQAHVAAPGRASLSYGIVDEANARSMALLEALGMQRIGSLATAIRYRQRRGRFIEDADVTSRLTDTARDAWYAQYSGAALRSEDPAHGDWITVSDAHGNIAACRHHVTELRLAPMTGAAGFVVEKMLPLFPPGRRRFNPRRFRFVSISDPVVPPGSEPLWHKLVAHLMALHDTHFVTFTLDPAGEATDRLRANGVIGRPTWRRRSRLQVLAGTHGIDGVHPPVRIHVSARDL